MLNILYASPGKQVERLDTPAEVKEALAKPDGCLWVDIQGRSSASDAVLREVFGFHELAIEDVYKDSQRPKVEDYDEYLYLIVHGLKPGWTLGEIQFQEIDLFLGPRFVVSHHSEDMPEVDVTRDAILKVETSVMDRGAVWLAHMLVDRLVDSQRPLADAYMDEIDHVEASVLKGGDELANIIALTRGLQRIRRMVLVERDVVGRLARAEFDEIPAEAKPFFRDVHQHLLELNEGLELQREELNAVFNAFHSLSAHRMNDIMKVLTLVSTIMLPLTFIVGVYGMNFDNMPELHWSFGYYGIWVLMLVTTVVMTIYFKFRRWF